MFRKVDRCVSVWRFGVIVRFHYMVDRWVDDQLWRSDGVVWLHKIILRLGR